MRTIGVITSGRADYGIYLPILRELDKSPTLELKLLVTGMHLCAEFGSTVEKIKEDGFEISERIESLIGSDSPAAISSSMAQGIQGFARAYQRQHYDILVVLGDRFEMHAAALAALPFNIPIAHIHGGELTQGAIDDSLRHSLTKLSHLHFVTTEEYRQRVIQLGEAPWRVSLSGAPSLDNLQHTSLLCRKEFQNRFGLRCAAGTLLVTYHPVTLEYQHTEQQIDQLLAALQACGQPLLFTMANADTHGRIINTKIEQFVAAHLQAERINNLGTQGYFSAMALAAAMVGNSSSGIIEAASFQLPVVNIGIRQQGRACGTNVIHTGNRTADILAGIGKALSPEFRKSLAGLSNPYGQGQAAKLIVEKLTNTPLDDKLLQKQFYDLGMIKK